MRATANAASILLIRRLAMKARIRHGIVAAIATGLVLGFAAGHATWNPMHRWNRALADISLVLIALSMGLGPLTRFLRAAVPALPFRREMGIHGCILALVHAANQMSEAEIGAVLDYIKSTWPERIRAVQSERTSTESGEW